MSAPPVTATLLGLPVSWHVLRYDINGQVLAVTAVTDDLPAGACLRCGHEQWHRSGQQSRFFRGEPIAGRTLIGRLTYTRWRCTCGGSRMPASLESMGKAEATIGLTNRVTKLALQHSNSDAARLTGINTQTAKGILAQTLPRLLEGYVAPAARYVGVDICRRWLLVVDLETGRRLDARRINVPSDLTAALRDLPWVPQVVVSDMEHKVLSAIRTAWPNARLVIDRFHVEQRVWVTVERVLRDGIQQGLFVGHHVALRSRDQQCGDPKLQLLLDWRNQINTLFEDAANPASLHAALSAWFAQVPALVMKEKRIRQLLSLLRGLVREIAEYANGRLTNGVTEALNKSVALLHQHGASLNEAAMRAKLLFRSREVDLHAEEQRLQEEINNAKMRLLSHRKSNSTPFSHQRHKPSSTMSLTPLQDTPPVMCHPSPEARDATASSSAADKCHLPPTSGALRPIAVKVSPSLAAPPRPQAGDFDVTLPASRVPP